MKAVIGLGNPGEKYKNNRHNIGHRVVEQLQKKNFKGVVLKMSDTFMNDSGSFVLRIKGNYKLESSDIYIVHDDLDIRLGDYKIQFGKGPKVHNGLSDIYQKLGTKDFWHVRVGVDNRTSENRTKGEEYVLSDFLPEEETVISKVVEDVCKKLEI